MDLWLCCAKLWIESHMSSVAGASSSRGIKPSVAVAANGPKIGEPETATSKVS